MPSATDSRATTDRAGLFGSDYFEAGKVRQSRTMTQSLYRDIAFSWLEKHRPDLVDGTGRRALEIGCGYGYCSELLAARGYEVVATDISPHAIAEAKKKSMSERVAFTTWDATTDPFFDGPFDLVFAFEVIEHLATPDAALRNWRDLLSQEGAFLLTTPNRLGPAGRPWKDPTHVNVRTAGAWRRSLRTVGEWADLRVGSVQGLPFVWRLDNVMRSVPLPFIGSTLRILASKR